MANSRPFTDLLREHGNGTTHDDLSDALQELVAKVAEHQKAGKLTFTISIKPAGRDSGALEVGADIKLALPKAAPAVSIFFVSPANNLVRQDPRQAALELKELGPALAHRGVA